MGSMRDIKQRIANVSSTGQIIKAMDMIASTKLHKARAQLEGVRPIYHELKRVVSELRNVEEAREHEFFMERKVKNTLYIILASDRGFSGGYNANIITKALEHMEEGKNEKILIVGAKGERFFRKKNKKIVRKIINAPDSQVYYVSEGIAKWAIDLYLSGEVDEVYLAYTHFENVLNHIPYVEKLLPIATENSDRVKNPKNTQNSQSVDAVGSEDIKYEPDIDTFIENLIPLYLHMYLFRAFSESLTSEHAARMVSMDAAGKNAEEMIEDLNRMYNRKRQAAITQELSEIVGSANILNKGEIHES